MTLGKPFRRTTDPERGIQIPRSMRRAVSGRASSRLLRQALSAASRRTSALHGQGGVAPFAGFRPLRLAAPAVSHDMPPARTTIIERENKPVQERDTLLPSYLQAAQRRADIAKGEDVVSYPDGQPFVGLVSPFTSAAVAGAPTEALTRRVDPAGAQRTVAGQDRAPRIEERPSFPPKRAGLAVFRNLEPFAMAPLPSSGKERPSEERELAPTLNVFRSDRRPLSTATALETHAASALSNDRGFEEMPQSAGTNDDRGTTDERPSIGTIHLDGSVLGQWITNHLERSLTQANRGPSGVDPRVVPTWGPISAGY